MPLIAITASNERHTAAYTESVRSRGGDVRMLTPDVYSSPAEAMDGVGGLLLTGGADVDPAMYGEKPNGSMPPHRERDVMEAELVRYALERDMPLFGICRGMQVINVAMGGRLIQDLPGHRLTEGSGREVQHPVYVSPGSRLAAIIGPGANYRANSRHHQGLKEAQRAPGLRACAYCPDDGIIEAVESPEHPWLIAVQFHPENEGQVSKGFLKLFDWHIGWAERYESGDMGGSVA